MRTRGLLENSKYPCMPFHIARSAQSFLNTVAVRYGLGRVRSYRYIPTGLINECWAITTPLGRFIVRRCRRYALTVSYAEVQPQIFPCHRAVPRQY